MKNEAQSISPKAREAVARAAAAAAAEGRAPRVLFVCLGNICRSPAAQGVAEAFAAREGVALECDSAGFYGGHAGELPDRRMREAAWQRGYRLEHRSRQIRLRDYDRFDLIIGMDDRNIDDLHRGALTAGHDDKIVRMTDFATRHPGADAVPDPYYGGAEGFNHVLDLLEDSCAALVAEFKGLN